MFLRGKLPGWGKAEEVLCANRFLNRYSVSCGGLVAKPNHWLLHISNHIVLDHIRSLHALVLRYSHYLLKILTANAYGNMTDNNGKSVNPIVFFDIALGGKARIPLQLGVQISSDRSLVDLVLQCCSPLPTQSLYLYILGYSKCSMLRSPSAWSFAVLPLLQ